MHLYLKRRITIKDIKTGVITISDSCYRRENHDTSGDYIINFLKGKGLTQIYYQIVPDEIEKISDCIITFTDTLELDLIITTGGTGLFPRDVTPEAVRPLLDKEIPGISEILRIKGYDDNPNAILSRSISGIRKKTLIITLPGSLKAVKFSLELIYPVLEHAVMKIHGDPTPCGGKV